MNEFILFGTTHLLTLSIIFGISIGVPFFLRNKYSLDSLSQFEKVLGCVLILIAPPLIYDFLPLLVFEYDCFDLIQNKESLY